MYELTTKITNNTLYYTFNGSITSNNAEEINGLIESNYVTAEKVVFDFGNVDYISSAGLRIVLKYSKTYPNFEVINVNKEVYEIFEMTGFTEMLNVKKAYKNV